MKTHEVLARKQTTLTHLLPRVLIKSEQVFETSTSAHVNIVDKIASYGDGGGGGSGLTSHVKVQ